MRKDVIALINYKSFFDWKRAGCILAKENYILSFGFPLLLCCLISFFAVELFEKNWFIYSYFGILIGIFVLYIVLINKVYIFRSKITWINAFSWAGVFALCLWFFVINVYWS